MLFFRDVRRLVVAMSRARLGLYVFARVSLFHNCFELIPAFRQLTSRPLQLHIMPQERFPPKSTRAPTQTSLVMNDMTQMHQFVYDMYIKMVQQMNNQQANVQETLEKPPPAEESIDSEKQEEVPIEFEVLAESESSEVKSNENAAEQQVDGSKSEKSKSGLTEAPEPDEKVARNSGEAKKVDQLSSEKRKIEEITDGTETEEVKAKVQKTDDTSSPKEEESEDS